MDILKPEIVEKIYKILPNSNYSEWIIYFEKILRATRQKKHKHNKRKLLRFQLGFAGIETKTWDNLRKTRETVKKLKALTILTEEQKNDLQNYESNIFINEQIIRISRTICDGIAWRNLKYNRTFLVSASRGSQAGDVNANDIGFKSEFRWACKISEAFNSVVLMNDTTRFLRIGDLTEINEKGIFIHEIKKKGKDVKNIHTLSNLKSTDKLSNQARRLLELQRIAFSNAPILKDRDVRTHKFKTSLRNNFEILKRLIKRAEKEFIVTEEIDSCLMVEVIDQEALIKDIRNGNETKVTSDLMIEARQKGYIIHSNYDAFYSDDRGNFLRTTIPYSIYPFSDKKCMAMISGLLRVSCFLNLEKFSKILNDNGWKTKFPTEADIDKQIKTFENAKEKMFTVKESLYDFAPEQIGIIEISRDSFNFSLTPEIHSRITMEFMSIETFLQLLEEMYILAHQRKQSDTYFIAFGNEAETWN